MKRIICILIILFIAGCQTDNRVRVNPKSIARKPIDNRQKWKAIAAFLKNHHKNTDLTVEEIAAELYYQEYLMNKKRAEASSKIIQPTKPR